MLSLFTRSTLIALVLSILTVLLTTFLFEKIMPYAQPPDGFHEWPAAKMEVKFPIGQEIDVVVTAMEGDRISLSLPGKTSQLAVEETENVGAMMRSNNRGSHDSMISSIGSILDEMFKQ